jgi:hypothetical protein
MARGESAYAHDCYAKRWDPVFSKERPPPDDGSYVESKRRMGAEGDDISLFLRDYEESIPSLKVQEVEAFCQGVRLEDLLLGRKTAGQLRSAWLDARSLPQQVAREYRNPLPATTLYEALIEPVITAPSLFTAQ